MTFEERFNSLKQAFTGKTAEVEAKIAELSAVNAKVEELTNALSAKEGTIVELTAKLAEASDKVALAEKTLNEIKTSQESAGKKAAVIAASVGVQPLEVNPAQASTEAKSDEDLVLEWTALKQKDAKAASEFYNKNRTAILRHAGL